MATDVIVKRATTKEVKQMQIGDKRIKYFLKICFNMTPDYQPIEKYLRELHYLKVNGKIRTWFGGSVVGFNVSASSLIRKPYTVERVKKEIEENDIPIFVDDYLGEGYNSFRLMIKL